MKEQLMKLLLEENAAAWDGNNWVEAEEDNMTGLWIDYLVNYHGGPRFQVYDNDYECIEYFWEIDELFDFINDYIK